MAGNIPEKEYASGVYKPSGEQIRFNRNWSSHRFSDQEVADLLEGKDISFKAKSKAGHDYVAQGRLEHQEYNGHPFWGFSLDKDALPNAWCGHTFTDEERKALLDGGTVYIPDAVSKAGSNFSCKVHFIEENGRKCIKIVPKDEE